VGRAVGLSGKTVGALRRRLGQHMPDGRVGQDGRVRPVSTPAVREALLELIEQHPGVSLREIARLAEVSPNTVRNARLRMTEGADDLTEEPPAAGPPPSPKGGQPPYELEETLLSNLSQDPSLRNTETGRALLRLRHQHIGTVDGRIIEALPEHTLPSVSRVARDMAVQWQHFADMAEGRANTEAF